MEMIDDWQTGSASINNINQSIFDSSFREAVLEKEQRFSSHMETITPQNCFTLIKKSEEFRGRVRGEAIGRLG